MAYIQCCLMYSLCLLCVCLVCLSICLLWFVRAFVCFVYVLFVRAFVCLGLFEHLSALCMTCLFRAFVCFGLFEHLSALCMSCLFEHLFVLPQDPQNALKDIRRWHPLCPPMSLPTRSDSHVGNDAVMRSPHKAALTEQ